MEIKRNKISLDKRYITEALENESLTKIVASNNPGIVHRIYLIKNGLKKRQEFLTVNDDRYIVNASISTNYAYAAAARRQAEVISFMKDLLKVKPGYTIRFSITDRSDMKELFFFKHVTNNIEEVVSLIENLEEKTKQLCSQNTY